MFFFYTFFFQWNWATNPESGIAIGIYPATSEDYLNDYSEGDVLCPPMPSGKCLHRFNVKGVFYFTTGKFISGTNFAFGVRVTVVDKPDTITVPVNVFISGKKYFQSFLLDLFSSLLSFHFHF